MGGFIMIDGLAFWVLLVIFILFCLLLMLSFKSVSQENKKLQKENIVLKCKLSRTEEKLFKATFTVPDVETKKGKDKNGRK